MIWPHPGCVLGQLPAQALWLSESEAAHLEKDEVLREGTGSGDGGGNVCKHHGGGCQVPIHVQSSRTKDQLDPGVSLPFNAQEVTPGLWDESNDRGGKRAKELGAEGTPALLSLAAHLSLSVLS